MKKNLVSLNKKRHIYYKIENGRNDLPKNEEESRHLTNSNSSNNDEKKVIGMESKRKKPIEPFWDDGKSEQSPKLPPVKRKKNKGSLKQSRLDFLRNIVFLSVVSAILVGGAFGMMLLSLFTNNSESTTNIEESSPQTQVQAVSAEGEDGKFSVPSLDVFVAQGGAFTTEEKGKEMQSSLSEQGQPSVLVKENDTLYLFMGVAIGQDNSAALGSYYQDKELDTYMKSYAIYDQQLEVDEPVHQFLDLGVQWMEGATQISMNEIAGTNPSDEEISQFMELGENWITSFKELPSQGETMNELMKDWIENSQAVMSVYSSSESSSPAWEVQESVLEGMLHYNAILDQLE